MSTSAFTAPKLSLGLYCFVMVKIIQLCSYFVFTQKQYQRPGFITLKKKLECSLAPVSVMYYIILLSVFIISLLKKRRLKLIVPTLFCTNATKNLINCAGLCELCMFGFYTNAIAHLMESADAATIQQLKLKNAVPSIFANQEAILQST